VLVTRPAVELARVGQWSTSTGPWNCTRTQLADAARAAASGNFRNPVLKPGHVDPRFDGEPALGQVRNVRLSADGDALLGDVQLPDWLDSELDAMYPSRSIEADLGVETAGGEHYSMVLTGLALLGVTRPAIQSLADLPQRVAASDYYTSAVSVAASLQAHGEPAGGDAVASPVGLGRPIGTSHGASSVDIAPAVREALGLDENADEAAAVAAISALRSSTVAPPPATQQENPVVTPEVTSRTPEVTQDAPVEAPLVTPVDVQSLVREQVAAALATHTAGQDALKAELTRVSGELAGRRQAEAVTKRETLLASAVDTGRIRPADRDRYAALYDQAPEATQGLIEALAPGTAVPVMASGHASAPEASDGIWADYYRMFPEEAPSAASPGIAVTTGQGLLLEVKGPARSVGYTTGASYCIVGVPLFDAATGKSVTVARGGEHKLVASGAITAGARVKSAAGGKVAAWIPGTDNPALAFGIALGTTTTDGDLVDVAWGF
jgi:hypothetical protein